MKPESPMKSILLCIGLGLCLAHGELLLGDAPRGSSVRPLTRRTWRERDLSFVGLHSQESKQGRGRTSAPDETQWSRRQHVFSLVLRKSLGVALAIALIGPNLYVNSIYFDSVEEK
uniref:Uncharacterized protein n=1 Tax=Hanusia phi TaxID=3032 RepID=A0A7S0H7L1_9CRYP|mmetsp:Transcript_10243/g.23382  ORF Transcript_10243/g.23382 Transcript_10243/m.23382 type:complete len:116 (+) Transcript_10243:221-568(+)